MGRNHLTPQDYSFMILSYLYKFTSLIFPVSISKITNYCVKNSKELDVGDEVEIRKIVSSTLKTLENHGYLAYAGGESYSVIKSLHNVDVVVFDNPEIKPNYKIVNEYLSNIDKRTRYGKLEAQNEETTLEK